jgi:glycerophosphoryl diester phosphodiesterase
MNIYNLIAEFNNFTENIFYVKIFWSVSILIFFLSFILQLFYDKYCDLFTELIRIIHHFSVFFIYCSFLAPTNYLFWLTIFPIVAILLWLLDDNKCFLTTIEQIRCNYKKNYRFHDLFYFIDLFLYKFKIQKLNVDKFNIKYRIPLLVILNIFIFLRLYVYFTSKLNKFEIQGHRGADGKYLGNTITAFDYAMNINVDTLEMDLNMTKDKNIVIYHDRNIDTEICKNGLSVLTIKEMKLSEIQTYNCKRIQDTSSEKIPTLIELLEFINNSNYPNKNTIKFNVEIKSEKNLDTNLEVVEFANFLINILNEYNIKDRTTIQSFDDRALIAVKNIDSSIKLSLLIEDPNINMIKLAKQIDVDIISPHYVLLDKELVREIHNNGFKVLPWTVNSTEHLQKMIDMNVDGIITDYPKEMMDYIDNTK